MIELDVYIASMGRSGSTALANFLTDPQKQQYIFVEPDIVNGPNAVFFDQLRDFQLQDQSHLGEFDFSNLRNAGAKVGVKEVKCSFHNQMGTLFKADKTIITCRSIDNVYLSLLEKHRLQQLALDDAWAFDYCVREANGLVMFAQKFPIDYVVKYEDFSTSQGVRDTLSDKLNFVGGGEVDRGFVNYGRKFEADMYAGHISSRKTPYQTITETDIRRASQLQALCSEYQHCFGYD
ncbi:hypothetical protein [Alteromonas sp. C1M14]|uniref:hypothetical protein n=1 Tax=Alteromonas sp. C1M14 TaxID=2841567 RepID=UPI001C0905C9|nr:hypothetical protein [Alteromonas sp. C1M14]MBU2977957.1 hypothetical protein [Alteromonas sp. C1M14]